MAQTGLTLTARLTATAVDARRGIVRLHREVLAALGVSPWDPLLLKGNRTTAALAAEASLDAPTGVILVDDMVLGNLGLADGSSVEVSPVPLREANSVVVAGTPEVMRAVPADMLRRALLGKVVSAGDNVSLLPQDVAPTTGLDRTALNAARQRLSIAMGFQWTTTLLTVTSTTPGGPILVTMGTTVAWRDGDSTAQALPPQGRRHGTSGVPAPTSGATSASAARATAEPVAVDTDVEAVLVEEDPAPAIEDLAGVEMQAASLREWFDLGFHHGDVLERLGAKPQMGVLVTGPAGVGKTALVRAVAAAMDAQLIALSAPTVAAVETQAAATQLRETFADAGRRTPSVLLIRDVEALAPRDNPPPLTRIFIDLVRRSVTSGTVAVVCTTAHPEQVSTELRRPGTLDHEVSLPLPDKAARRALLDVLLRPVPLAEETHLDEVASRTPGFVAADLLALRREATLRAALRQKTAEQPTVSMADLLGALDVVRPTAMADSTLEVGRVTLDDVGDMVETKQALTEAVLWPLRYPDTFDRLGVSPPRGVLLYGPPGCGKTYLVKAIAGSGQANVLSVKGAELLTKWVGESERAVRELFRRARQAAPTLVFMDEIDALAPQRGQASDGGTTDRVVAALLTELDGVEDLRDVVVIGATNRPDLIDPALLRPGRLERLVYVPPPDADARAAILLSAAKNTPLTDGVDLAAIATGLDGFSAADCTALIREAALTAMRRDLDAPKVTKRDVDAALKAVRPSLDPVQVAYLAAYAESRAG